MNGCCDLQFSMENYRGLIQDMSPQDREVSRPKQFSLLLCQIILIIIIIRIIMIIIIISLMMFLLRFFRVLLF